MRRGKPKDTIGKSIFDQDKELKKKALEASKKHIDTKPIKYLLKR